MVCERTIFFVPGEPETSSVFSSPQMFEAAVRGLLPAQLRGIPLRVDSARHVHRPGTRARAAGQNFLYDSTTGEIRSLDDRELFRRIPVSYRICRVYAEDDRHAAQLAAAMDRLTAETTADDATEYVGVRGQGAGVRGQGSGGQGSGVGNCCRLRLCRCYQCRTQD